MFLGIKEGGLRNESRIVELGFSVSLLKLSNISLILGFCVQPGKVIEMTASSPPDRVPGISECLHDPIEKVCAKEKRSLNWVFCNRVSKTVENR